MSFLNLAGGIRLGDPGIDLAVVAAILSSTLDLTLDPKTALCGEVGLTGEVRPVGACGTAHDGGVQTRHEAHCGQWTGLQRAQASQRTRARAGKPRRRASKGSVLRANQPSAPPTTTTNSPLGGWASKWACNSATEPRTVSSNFLEISRLMLNGRSGPQNSESSERSLGMRWGDSYNTVVRSSRANAFQPGLAAFFVGQEALENKAVTGQATDRPRPAQRPWLLANIGLPHPLQCRRGPIKIRGR